jgi:Na+-transporting NADH:ubiquinone oxidoreductase subunit A
VYAVLPSDFRGLVPKLVVKEGDRVLAGSILFHDKADARIKIASPVSGEVARIERGDKRKILSVVILADAETEYSSQPSGMPANREDAIHWLCESGAWPLIESRPYGRIASPDAKPKAVFINVMVNLSVEHSRGIVLIMRNLLTTLSISFEFASSLLRPTLKALMLDFCLRFKPLRLDPLVWS